MWPSVAIRPKWCNASGQNEEIFAPLKTNEKSTYGQILKSSAIIGGASALNIGFGIIRTKVMAVLLGPAGLGVMGLYSSISDLTRSLAVMGINDSGVRQIAAAISTGD